MDYSEARGVYLDKHGCDVFAVRIGLTKVPAPTLRFVKHQKQLQDELDLLPEDSLLRREVYPKIKAIKLVREDTGCGLGDAKSFVEFVWSLM